MKTVSVPPGLTKIPQRKFRNQTQVSTVKGRRLTATTMTRRQVVLTYVYEEKFVTYLKERQFVIMFKGVCH